MAARVNGRQANAGAALMVMPVAVQVDRATASR